MNYLRFEAEHVETSAQNGVVIVAAASAGSKPKHYVILQVEDGAKSSSEVYSEFNDQINGQVGRLVSTTIEGSVWTVRLSSSAGDSSKPDAIEVFLKKEQLPDFRAGLQRFLQAAKMPLGNGA